MLIFPSLFRCSTGTASCTYLQSIPIHAWDVRFDLSYASTGEAQMHRRNLVTMPFFVMYNGARTCSVRCRKMGTTALPCGPRRDATPNIQRRLSVRPSACLFTIPLCALMIKVIIFVQQPFRPSFVFSAFRPLHY